MTFDFDNLIGRDKIALIYVAYYGRLPDPNGLNFWSEFFDARIAAGASSEQAALQITDLFLDQDETRANYQFFETPQNASMADVSLFLDEVYQNLFNRAPDEEGKAFWSAEIVDRLGADTGFSDILTQIIEGAQTDDIPAIDNKLFAANFYTLWVGPDYFDLTEATELAQNTTGTPASLQQTLDDIDSLIILDEIQAQTNSQIATPPQVTTSDIINAEIVSDAQGIFALDTMSSYGTDSVEVLSLNDLTQDTFFS